MDAKLVALRRHAALLVFVEKSSDRRHEERCLGAVLCKRVENAWHAFPIAILALRHPADRLAAIPQFVCLVIGIERERHCAARSVLPARRFHRSSSADVVDLLAPDVFLRPRLLLRVIQSDCSCGVRVWWLSELCDNYDRPPSTEMIWPEIQPAMSEARNITASAISFGWPSLRV